MTSSKYHKLMLGLGLAGTLFAGYLSGVKLFSKVCAFGESCPYFLGHPSCYFGLAMFFAMFLIALYAVMKNVRAKWPAEAIMTVSMMGILFAGYFTAGEMPGILDGSSSYSLGLPTCAYGLVFYILMFVISTIWYSRHRHQC